MSNETIGVVGAGVIGASVAHAAAETGYRVVLVDVDAATLDRARRTIRDHARMRRFTGGREAPSPDEVLARVDDATDLAALADVPVVVENVTEDLTRKLEVHKALDAVAGDDQVVLVNTSAIPITRLADVTGRPGAYVGVHFMNPVASIDTVEVIRTAATSDATLRRVTAFLATMGKRYEVVEDAPGFVINRVLMLTVNEASAVVEAGTAGPGAVDRLFEGCLGHRMGPLATADLIGIDTVVRTLDVLLAETGDPRFIPTPLLREMVAEGRLGRKTGEGFHAYTAGGAASAR